jgi:ABC-type Na+ efflux pump permease subunit
MMWRSWWFDIFNTTTWIALLLLLFLGSYLLVEDIAKEERRGTLDFVRLSPESAQSVLLGKLLGVPILLYAAIVLAVPLHFWAAINAGLSLLTIANVYALIATSCSFAYAFATFHALGWGAKAQIFYILPIPCLIYFFLWLFSFYGRDLGLHENAQDSVFIASFEPGFFFSFLLVTFTALSFELWSGCIHRFHLPPLRR